MEAPLKNVWPNPNFPYQLPSFNLNKDPSKDDPCFLKKIDSIRQQFDELGIPSLNEDFLGTLTPYRALYKMELIASRPVLQRIAHRSPILPLWYCLKIEWKSTFTPIN